MENTLIDWGAAKTEYVTQNLSYREIAKRHGASLSAVGRAARRGDWRREKREHVEAIVRAAVERAGAEKTERLSHLMDATNAAVDAALAAVADGRQFNRYIVTRRIGYDNPKAGSPGEPLIKSEEIIEERQFEKIDSKALKEYTAALSELCELVRDFYDIPTPADAETRRISSARLELEREKAGADAPGGSAPVQTEVRFVNADWMEEGADGGENDA